MSLLSKYRKLGWVPPIAGGDGDGDSTVTQTGDPIARAINEIRLGALRGGMGITGGFDPFFKFDPRSQPGSRELDLLGRIGGFADRPGVSPLSSEAMDLIRSSFDPGTARQTLEQIVGPQLINQLTASGMGRSGAIGEALAGAGARLALPLQELRGQAGRSLFDIGNLLEGRELSRLQTGLQAASVPRQAELAEFRRPLDLLMSLMGPQFIPQGASSTQTTSQPGGGLLNTFLGTTLAGLGTAFGGPVGGALGSGLVSMFTGGGGGGAPVNPFGSLFDPRSGLPRFGLGLD